MQQAIIFPETYPKQTTVLPLLLVFKRIVYCQAVENSPPELQDPRMQEAVARELLAYHAPAPLGEDRERFLHLTRDLKDRRDDYAAQLSSLSLAGLSNDSGAAERRTSIITSLLDKKGINEKKEQQEAMLLWQARLLLILGEHYDLEQEELKRDLQRVHARQEDLLSELRQETETPFELTETLRELNSHTDAMLQHRLRAWTRLISLGADPLPLSILVTTSQDALDSLVDRYLSECDQPPAELCSIELPVDITDDNYFEKQQDMRTDETGAIDTFSAMDHDNCHEFAAQWNQRLETLFPAKENSRQKLLLYNFANSDPATFLRNTFADEKSLQTAIPPQKGEGFLVGLLRPLQDR